MALINPVSPRRGSVVGFRINPSSAAQYGQDLISRRRAEEEAERIELERRIEQLEADIAEGIPSNPYAPNYYDPRSGYADSYRYKYDPNRADPNPQRYPSLRDPHMYADSPAYEDYVWENPIPSMQPKPKPPRYVNDFVRATSGYGSGTIEEGRRSYAQADADARARRSAAAQAVESYLAELQYQRDQLEAERDKALAESREDIAAHYDEQIADINEDIGILEGNLADLNKRVPDYLSDAEARWNQAVEAAKNIVATAGPELEAVKNEALKNIEAAYDSAADSLGETLRTIGAGEAATASLEGMVRELESLAYETVEGQHEDVAALNAAAEEVAVAVAQHSGLTDAVEVKRFQEKTEHDIKKAIDQLVENRTKLEEAKKRALEKAAEEINKAFDDAMAGLEYPDQLTFAMSVVESGMAAWFSDHGFDLFEQQDVMATFEALLGQGIRSSTDLSGYLADIQEEQNAILQAIAAANRAGDTQAAAALQGELAKLPTIEPEVQEALRTMFEILAQAMAEWENNQPDPGTFGFSGSGVGADNTNPANIAAAKNGTGAYGARARYVAEVGDYIARTWGIEVQGANYFRPTNATGKGRSKNSDHFTAGALDLMLNPNNPEHMKIGAQIMAWLKTVPGVAYTIWNPDNPNDAHWNHIHVSFKLSGGGPVPTYSGGGGGGRSSGGSGGGQPSGGGGAYAV